MAYQPPPGYPPPPPSGYGPPLSGNEPPPGTHQYGQPPYGQYAQPTRPPGPATHPYATAALVLGLIAFCSTVLTGVPAIILGYQATRAIEAEPQRFKGKDMATACVILGWIGCAFFALLFGSGMGGSSTVGAVIAIGFGLAAAAGAGAAAKKWSRGIPRGIAFVSSPVLLIMGGVLGMVGARADAAERVVVCQQNENDAQAQLAAKSFSAAHNAVKAARTKCADTEEAKLADLDRNITQQEQAAEKADADRIVAEQAAAAAAKEKEAIQTFPQKSAEIATSYKRALNETYGGRWADADGDLGRAEAELSSFNGTSVVQSKPYQDLTAQLSALRAKIDPQLQQIAKQKAAAEQAAEAAEAARAAKEQAAQAAQAAKEQAAQAAQAAKEQAAQAAQADPLQREMRVLVTVQCEDAIQQNAKDPSSVEWPGVIEQGDHPEMRPFNGADGKWHWNAWFSATNSFGGRMRSKFRCTFDPMTGTTSVKIQ